MFQIVIVPCSRFKTSIRDTAQKMKLSIKDFFSTQETADMVKFTEEILNGILHFFTAVRRVSAVNFLHRRADEYRNEPYVSLVKFPHNFAFNASCKMHFKTY